MPEGKLVVLTALDPENAETLRGWINDPETHRWMLSGHVPVSKAEELAFYEASEASKAAGTAYRFEIHARDDGRLLGVCGLEHVDLVHRHAEVGICIGPKAERGKGFGLDAVRTVLAFAFGTLGLERVNIVYVGGNERAGEVYRRAGFRDAGRLRGWFYLQGRREDSVILDVTRDEYEASRREDASAG